MRFERGLDKGEDAPDEHGTFGLPLTPAAIYPF
jgi:hypothetical protein